VQDGVENRGGGVALEGEAPSSHFVENHSKGKKIGARVEFFAKGLLGRHVGDSTESGSGTGELVGIGGQRGQLIGGVFERFRRGDFGQTKIEDFGVAAFGDEDICWLDVAMDDALGVCGIESIGNLDGDVEKAFEFDRLTCNKVFERGAVEKFHGEECLIAVSPDFVDGADIGMIECRSGTGFATEAFEYLRVAGEIIRKKLESNKAAEFEVFGFVDHTHPAAAELLQDAVVGDGLAEARLGLRHGAAILWLASGRVNEKELLAAQIPIERAYDQRPSQFQDGRQPFRYRLWKGCP